MFQLCVVSFRYINSKEEDLLAVKLNKAHSRTRWVRNGFERILFYLKTATLYRNSFTVINETDKYIKQDNVWNFYQNSKLQSLQ
jgi:hypothetical protein